MYFIITIFVLVLFFDYTLRTTLAMILTVIASGAFGNYIRALLGIEPRALHAKHVLLHATHNVF